MSAITIPPELSHAVEEDDYHLRRAWLAALPDQIRDVASEWGLELGEPYLPGGQCAWVAPVRNAAGEELALKVGWVHREAAHEADALRFWDGDGAVRCLATTSRPDTTVLLLERCEPGRLLRSAHTEPEQDLVIAGLLRRLWQHQPPPGHPFGTLQEMCEDWARWFELGLESDHRGVDRGLAREAIAIFRELPGTAGRNVLLCTDLHAGNVLAAQREPWLVIDPKPFIGDPAFDAVQHMLNCDERLVTDPGAMSRRMADLLDVDPGRVRLWLFARCVQDSQYDRTMREAARLLAP